MVARLRQWLSCPSCESSNTGLLAYDDALSVECYDCGAVDEFRFGEPPIHEFGTDRSR